MCVCVCVCDYDVNYYAVCTFIDLSHARRRPIAIHVLSIRGTSKMGVTTVVSALACLNAQVFGSAVSSLSAVVCKYMRSLRH